MDGPEAETSEAFIGIFRSGKSPHFPVHLDTDQGYYVLRSVGTLQSDAENLQYSPIPPGLQVRSLADTIHRVRCGKPDPLGLWLVGCFFGLRPKDAPTWESQLSTIYA